MAVEQVELKVRRGGYVINGGDLTTTVDMSDDGQVHAVFTKLLKAAASRDGRDVGDYVMDVHRGGSLYTTFVTA